VQSLVEPEHREADRAFIASIDAEVVRQMFGEDLTVFRSALSILLRDHAGFGMPITTLPDEQGARSQLQLRVHALRGSTGLLGAIRITRLAERAETALEQGRSANIVDPLLRQLTSAFVQLRDEAVLWLGKQIEQGTRSSARVQPHPTVAYDDLVELKALLDRRDLAALDKFSLLSASLIQLFGAVRFDPLRDAMDNVEFALAATLLHQAMIASAQGR
jgi:HPt (histidine-containing phosphotransfer) domain-containing protein